LIEKEKKGRGKEKKGTCAKRFSNPILFLFQRRVHLLRRGEEEKKKTGINYCFTRGLLVCLPDAVHVGPEKRGGKMKKRRLAVPWFFSHLSFLKEKPLYHQRAW